MTQPVPTLERLLDVCARAGMQPTADELAEMLWLAARLPEARASAAPAEPAAPHLGLPPATPREAARPSMPAGRGETFGSASDSVSAAAHGSPATANLYPMQSGAQHGDAARPIRSPATFALPGSLELGRSLRPLKRTVPSHTTWVLDERATAEHIADSGDWTPVLRPAPERWLDVLLLVDESPSMLIWQRSITEIERLLERQGAFGDVELLGFRAAPDDASVQMYVGTGRAPNQATTRRPAELLDPFGRRLIILISDCVAPVWHNGVMANVLAELGKQGMIVLAQVLPDRLWVRTGLRTFPSIYMRSPAPGATNSQFAKEWTTYRPRKLEPRGVCVPVVTLEPLSLGYWASAIAGNSNIWIAGVFAIPTAAVGPPGDAPAAPSQPAGDATPEQLVRLFYGTASPTARRLAGYLAAAPLILPIMRLVQRALLPQSRQVHLAEVWLSGLIVRPSAIDPPTPADSMEFFFVDGVRDILLNNLRLSEALDVLSAVSSYVGERIGQPLDFAALVADPTASGGIQIGQGYQSFARIAASALRRFGSQYAELAQRLDASVHGNVGGTVEQFTRVTVELPKQHKTPHAPREQRAGTIRALLVGINRYASINTTMAGAVEDISHTRDWLKTRCGVDGSDILELLDERATKQAIVGGWRRLVSRIEHGDQLFLYYSGFDQQIVSSDPNEPDGRDETLFVFDSRQGERETLLTHQELADLAEEVEQRGGRVVMVLDTCRSSSGALSRRALAGTLVLAAAAENQEAYEKLFEDKRRGAASYFLAETMQAYQPGQTWLDVFDSVFANVTTAFPRQTPQLIGAGDVAVFGSERKQVLPYLLVTKAGERELEVRAPAALGLGTGERGARLAIYPPGSAMDGSPLAYARVQRLIEDTAVATLESPVAVPPASRARLLDYGSARLPVVVNLDASLAHFIYESGLLANGGNESNRGRFNVSMLDGLLVIDDGSGYTYWREQPAPDMDLSDRVAAVRGVLEQMATYIRTLMLAADSESELAVAMSLEAVGTASSGNLIALAESEALILKLRNRSAVDLFVSVWMLDHYLGVQRIFPSTTPCVLLGAGREIQLAVDVPAAGATDQQMQLTFKVFASLKPADLSVLAQPRMEYPILGELPLLQPTASLDASTAAQPPNGTPGQADAVESGGERPWSPGGMVGVTAKLWRPGRTLRVKFLNGEPEVQARVRELALEWTTYANVHFRFVEHGDAELRITFDKTTSWSYVGTDCLVVPPEQPTISLGSLTATSSDDEYRLVVLRQFGIALGLGASQQSPVANIPWNKAATYAYFGKLGWNTQTVDRNIFQKYDPDHVRAGAPDPFSIMYHPIPREATDGKVEFLPGTQLSEGDKRFIAQLYPFSGASR